MASNGSTTVNATYTTSGKVGDALLFSWWVNSQSIPNNTTNIGWKLELVAYGAGYIASSATKSWSITVNGTSYSGTNTVGISSNSTKLLASGSTTIGHNNDGSKTFSYSFSQQFNITFNSSVGTVQGNGSGTLPVIPRYADGVSFSSSIPTQTSADFTWSASQICSHITIYVDNVVKYSQDINTNSGTVKLSSFEPDKQYSVKINLKRKDSGLAKDYSTLTIRTQPIASLTSPVNMTIGSNLTLTFANADKNASVIHLFVEDDSDNWVQIPDATKTVEMNQTSYIWSLSTLASTLYSKCTTKNSMRIKVSVGVTLNNIRYENIYTGTASVINSNPVFSSFTAANTVSEINTLLGSTLHLPRGYGNIRATIPAANKATAKNSAIIKNYNIQIITDGKTVKSSQIDYSSTAAVVYDIGTFDNIGTYTIKIFATDSRGNNSSTVTKTFTVIPYHVPIPYITLYRHNQFEKEILISSYFMYSSLLINNVSKNTTFTVKYRYAEAGSTTWSNWTALSLKDDTAADINEKKKIYEQTSSASPLINLDNTKSYNFEFELVDSFSKALGLSVITSLQLPQGIPIMLEADNGFISIGRIPNWNSSARLQVDTDVLVKDTDGKDRLLLDTIKNYVIYSSTEPENQIVGGIWCKTS